MRGHVHKAVVYGEVYIQRQSYTDLVCYGAMDTEALYGEVYIDLSFTGKCTYSSLIWGNGHRAVLYGAVYISALYGAMDTGQSYMVQCTHQPYMAKCTQIRL